MRFSEKKKRGERVMPVSIIRIYLLNDLYARALSTHLIPSAPNLMSPCAERGCLIFHFDIAMKYSQLHLSQSRIFVTIKRRKLVVYLTNLRVEAVSF